MVLLVISIAKWNISFNESQKKAANVFADEKAAINSKDGVRLLQYINCLVNSKDFRAIYIINKEIQEDLTRAMQLKKEEITKDMVTFHHFLRRRKAYTLVNMGRLDEAE